MPYIILFLIVLLGGFLAYTLKLKDKYHVNLLLSFSGAYLLSVIVFHLLPEVYIRIDGKTAGFFIMLGIMFQMVLELFSQGAEHGHKHKFHHKSFWLVFISLCIHAFLEGLPITEGHRIHYSFFYGILIHKLPIAIVLTTLMLQSKFSKIQIFIYLFVFALMTPLAAFVGNRFDFILVYGKHVNAFVIGILAHIGTTILFENEHSHAFHIRKFLLMIIAISIAFISA